MAVQAPPELETPEVILRAMGSVMAGDTRSPARKLLDLILGGNPAERMAGVAPMRIGVMPGRERIASDIIKRGLKEPWFHGTPASPGQMGHLEELLRSGFNPEKIGGTSGLRLGEPAGVSLTRSPEVARKFGDVLRVGVDIPPSSVGQFVDPEMQRLMRAAYESANTSVAPAGTIPEVYRAVNQHMSDYLRQQGVEAIAYNPRRWAEYEMRVLDPSKAVPLGRVDAGTPGPAAVQRYLYGYRGPHATLESIARSEGSGGLIERLRQQYLTAPEFPVRLRDVLGVAGAD